MHELSIAESIIEIAEEQARKSFAISISEIEIDIGSFSGVVIEAMEFALEEAVKNTMLEKASIKINQIKAKVICCTCANEFFPEDVLSLCPQCNSSDYDILQGKELNVKSIIIES